ncbi:MAG: NAD(P)-dependent alcohol dehydrogenase [Acidobacteriota bacterium]|nr:NAD(P)-dependent alcohol dehydrogenase [Acidobacteriota bacterium]
MKAVVYERYGSPDVLELRELAMPSPAPDEVLIRVRAAALNPLDWHFVRGTPYAGRAALGIRKPRNPRLGVDVAGIVERVGASVGEFQPGDAVFGAARGALSEFVCASASRLASKPEKLTFEQAAAVPVAGFTALQGLRDKGRIRAGQRLLINGASGGVGTFAVQIAKAFDAHVTAVCSARNVDLVQSIGADRVIDYTTRDFTTGDARYDLIFDCIGNHDLTKLRRVLQPDGTYVIAGGPDGRWLGPIVPLCKVAAAAPFVRQRLVVFLARQKKEDLVLLRDLLASETIKPVVDRVYPFVQSADALRYLETGHARGKVVVRVA